MGLEYVVGIQPMLSIWPAGQEPLPPKLRQRAPHHQPVLAQDLALGLPPRLGR